MCGPAWIKALLDGLPKPSEQRSELVAVILIHTLFMGCNVALTGIVLTQSLATRSVRHVAAPSSQPEVNVVRWCSLEPHQHSSPSPVSAEEKSVLSRLEEEESPKKLEKEVG